MFQGWTSNLLYYFNSAVLICLLVAASISSMSAQERARIRRDGVPAIRWANLPTDRSLQSDNDLLEGGSNLFVPARPPANRGQVGNLETDRTVNLKASSPDFAKLLRPTFRVALEWEPEVDDVEIGSYDFSMRMPTYPVFGPPPPFVDVGFSFTDIQAPAELDLPAELYDASLGMSWMRRINDRWMLRFSASAAFASDSHNESSDAWQFRGTAFAMYSPNDRWNWAFGAVATGRQDIPVIPAIGAIWQPMRFLRVDLMFPQPRISWVGFETPTRQQWFYVGGGLSGGTWAYRRNRGTDDLVTYREWRAVLGWESTPPKQPGTFFARGTKFGAEIGYSFGRQFEFESGTPDLEPGSGLLLRATASF